MLYILADHDSPSPDDWYTAKRFTVVPVVPNAKVIRKDAIVMYKIPEDPPKNDFDGDDLISCVDYYVTCGPNCPGGW